MNGILEGAGWFVIPLGLCSILMVFILAERLFALRNSKILPKAIVDSFVTGEVLELEGDHESVAGRILFFYQLNRPDPDALKAFASLETARLERGMFILDIVVGAAPLLGLLGTVTGLIDVFSGIDPESGLPDPTQFMQGIAMALTTTMLGLSIAIPALVGASYLSRRVDMLTAQIYVGVERMVDLAKSNKAKA
ncbi:MotA/TolQ/ExbB proton channel family protein [Cerasicoccus arenae]|uniref:Biopolymer transporter ExbB n=1 Tax=Cerasicoccus arenae TaxID=424488 RepID=A0A8J3DFB2_9BACT|nr:MotA/TolQ/ExbB proton channel family protein [Cerasicoccus arenae]MBK1857074.1 MotA/TolQ/ExbB proton channel family protein [Cerasicoccus arenae]GHB92218.1 biopolymer transporter ExbB [Cerasicoccus arenae]